MTLFAEEFCYDGSPWVTQGNVFPLRADFLPHLVYCRLAERHVLDNNLTGTVPPDRLWSVEDPSEPCLDGGGGGIDKARISLDHITALWDAYPAAPKFAYLSAVAAHDYNPRWGRATLAAESYDVLLSSFLTSMFKRAGDRRSRAGDADLDLDLDDETVVVVRSDHGLQFGPLAVDHSTQVEHVRPWTEMAVPVSLLGEGGGTPRRSGGEPG